MVKKTYIIPTTQMVAVQQQMVIAWSVTYDTNEGNNLDNGEILVKGDRTRPSAYNVWDDDWSNN